METFKDSCLVGTSHHGGAEGGGLPDGVINLVYAGGREAAEVVFNHRDFAGLHFTGSTNVFNGMWSTIAGNIGRYKSYPRIVGETGGKDYILAEKSANAKQVATAITRGAFEYQGQKCSAASRAYIPTNMWEEVRSNMSLMTSLKSRWVWWMISATS